MIKHLVQVLIQKEILDKEYREEYEYVLATKFEKIVAYSILLLVAFGIGKSIQGMVFAISFASLRQTPGGFHAESFLGCLFGSVLTLLSVVMIIVPLAEHYVEVVGILLLLSIVCIVCLAPVNHPNLALSQEEKKKHRCLCIVVLSVELGIIGIGEYLQVHFQRYMIAAVILCAVFILLAKIIRQEVQDSEKKW